MICAHCGHAGSAKFCPDCLYEEVGATARAGALMPAGALHTIAPYIVNPCKVGLPAA